MTTLEEMFQQTTARFHNQLKKSCEPLYEHFGINNFFYNKLTNCGDFISIGNNPDWMECYFGEKWYLKQPHFRNPNCFQNGISVPKSIQNREYEQMIHIAKKKFNINFSLILLNKVVDALEIVGLDVNTDNKLHDTLLLNEMAAIRKFIPYFVEKNKQVLKVAEENKVNMKALMGERFNRVDIPVMATLPDRSLFLKKIGVTLGNNLSKREQGVLKLLVKGFTASQMAIELDLSCRTVEHHIERIKEKLVCFSKAELIQKARELELYGYL